MAPDLTDDAASRLLRLGMPGPRRPIDDVIDRLRERDGERWLIGALASGPMESLRALDAALLDGHVALADLVAVKDACKTFFDHGPDTESRLTGIVSYFLAIAAALVHHGTLITSNPREEIDAALVDLAAVTPDPWRDLLDRAALAEGAEPG